MKKQAMIMGFLLAILLPLQSVFAGSKDILITEVHVTEDINGAAVALEILGTISARRTLLAYRLSRFPMPFLWFHARRWATRISLTRR